MATGISQSVFNSVFGQLNLSPSWGRALLDAVNQSPSLQQAVNDYAAGIDLGNFRPIEFNDFAANPNGSLAGTNTDGLFSMPSGGGLGGVDINIKFATSPDYTFGDFLHAVSHELAHVVYNPVDTGMMGEVRSGDDIKSAYLRREGEADAYAGRIASELRDSGYGEFTDNPLANKTLSSQINREADAYNSALTQAQQNSPGVSPDQIGGVVNDIYANSLASSSRLSEACTLAWDKYSTLAEGCNMSDIKSVTSGVNTPPAPSAGDVQGSSLSFTDSNGATTTISIDANGYAQIGYFDENGLLQCAQEVGSDEFGNQVTTTTNYNSNGNVSSTQTQTVDSHGNSITKNYDGSGVLLNDSWSQESGPHGTDVYNTDGSSVSTTVDVDGSSVVINRDGQGNVTTDYYDSNGILTGDSWSHADGSHGNDSYNADGSSTSTAISVDGSSVVTVNDGRGNITVSDYNSSGTLTYDSWSHSDGSYGTDTYNSNGSSVSTATNADGSSAVTTNDGQGNINTNDYNGTGTLTGDSWSHADGSHGSDVYSSDGSSTSTTVNANGSSVVTTHDGHGDTSTSDYDSGGKLLDDNWHHADGTYGTDTYNADGSWVAHKYGATPGNEGTYDYDSSGTLIHSLESLTNADGSVAKIEFRAGEWREEFDYSASTGDLSLKTSYADGSYSNLSFSSAGIEISAYGSDIGETSHELWTSAYITETDTFSDGFSCTGTLTYLSGGAYSSTWNANDGSYDNVYYDGAGHFTQDVSYVNAGDASHDWINTDAFVRPVYHSANPAGFSA
jgi:hypothetical protein